MNVISITQYQPEEINEKLSYITSEEDILNLILSAIYFCDTKFAGDHLLKILQNSSGSLSLSLMRLTNTFLQMHKTNYNAGGFLMEMKKRVDFFEDSTEILDLIEGVVELDEMFSSSD